MKRLLTLALFLFCCVASTAQERKKVFPLGLFHKPGRDIYGIAVGIINLDNTPATRSYGLRIEVIGGGIFGFFIPRTPTASSDSQFVRSMAGAPSERIHGLSLSPAGTMCECDADGMALSGISSYLRDMRGLAACGFMNFVQRGRGMQLGALTDAWELHGIQLGLYNRAARGKALQIGLFNYNSGGRGMQIGLINKMGNRELPLVNWRR